MKITILGCGSSAGVPMIGGEEGEQTGLWGVCDPGEPKNRRTRSSIVIEKDDFRLLVDSGPDFRTQMLRCGLGRVDAVLYTHAHGDHIGGLDDLRAINRVINRPLPLFATSDVLDELRNRFAYAFTPWKGPEFYRPVFEERVLRPGQKLDIGPLSGEVFAQHHAKILSLGMRFGPFAYCTDVGDFPESSLQALIGVQSWIVGCFQRKPHPAHAWLDRVIEWHERLGAERTVLTHMGPDMDYASLCRDLPPGLSPAYDGMVLTVS